MPDSMNISKQRQDRQNRAIARATAKAEATEKVFLDKQKRGERPIRAPKGSIIQEMIANPLGRYAPTEQYVATTNKQGIPYKPNKDGSPQEITITRFGLVKTGLYGAGIDPKEVAKVLAKRRDSKSKAQAANA